MNNANANFASYLIACLEAKKINNTAFTKDFIESFNEGSNQKEIAETPTNEMLEYAKIFVGKKAKSTDANFTELMVKWATVQPTIAEAQVSASSQRTYRGEY